MNAPSDDPIRLTRQTYDAYASEHAERFWQASVKESVDAFATLMPARGLILDLGCGAGRDLAAFQERGFRVVGADLSWGLLCEARQRVDSPLVQADMRALPFANNRFDGIWLCASLLHIPRPQAPGVLAGVRRLLGLSSTLFVSVKQGQGEAWHDEQAPRYFTYYEPDEIRQMLAEAELHLDHIWINPAEVNNWIHLIAYK